MSWPLLGRCPRELIIVEKDLVCWPSCLIPAKNDSHAWNCMVSVHYMNISLLFPLLINLINAYWEFILFHVGTKQKVGGKLKHFFWPRKEKLQICENSPKSNEYEKKTCFARVWVKQSPNKYEEDIQWYTTEAISRLYLSVCPDTMIIRI